MSEFRRVLRLMLNSLRRGKSRLSRIIIRINGVFPAPESAQRLRKRRNSLIPSLARPVAWILINLL